MSSLREEIREEGFSLAYRLGASNMSKVRKSVFFPEFASLVRTEAKIMYGASYLVELNKVLEKVEENLKEVEE